MAWVLRAGGGAPAAHDAGRPAGGRGQGPVAAVSRPADRAGRGAAAPELARLGAGLGGWRCQAEGGVRHRWGGEARPASSAAGPATAGRRRAEVAEAVALQASGVVQGRPGAAPPTAAASAPSRSSLRTLEGQRAGTRRAGKPHAACAVAGAETWPRWPGAPLPPSPERHWHPSTYSRRACPRPYQAYVVTVLSAMIKPLRQLAEGVSDGGRDASDQSHGPLAFGAGGSTQAQRGCDHRSLLPLPTLRICSRVDAGWRHCSWRFWTAIMPSTRWGCAGRSAPACCRSSSLGVDAGPPCMITDWGRSSILCSLQTSIRCWRRGPAEPSRSMPSQRPGSIRIRPRSRCMGPMKMPHVKGLKTSKRLPHRSPLGQPMGTAKMGTMISSRCS